MSVSATNNSPSDGNTKCFMTYFVGVRATSTLSPAISGAQGQLLP